jgi:hypothetical protein
MKGRIEWDGAAWLYTSSDGKVSPHSTLPHAQASQADYEAYLAGKLVSPNWAGWVDTLLLQK